MRTKRLLVSVAGVLLGVLAAVPAAGTAEAASTADHGAAVVLTTPPAPAHARGAAIRPAAANAPAISPSVTTQHVPPNTAYSCPVGTLCASVWDPTASNFKVFHLAICAKYTLSYWGDGGQGTYYDNQTGGVTSYFYDKTGNPLKSFKPDATNHDYSWAKVWSIRNCS